MGLNDTPISESISHYRILNKLGAGGMGEVYLAQDTHLDRKVAIKVLPPQLVADERARKRLIHEAKAAARLDHPNICAIHVVAEEKSLTFIVMQYIEGETLASRIHRKPLGVRESLALAVQVADALSEAHAQGVVHRDIKPQNIMISARGQIKVLDFGLAKVLTQKQVIAGEAETELLMTEPGAIVGTVSYMSPEQAKGEPLDGRSDIFSFGSLLYEMVSGHQPFRAESAAATLSAILTREPPPLARYADVPPELQRIVRKCLAKDKGQRYQSASDLLIDLGNLKPDSEIGADSVGRAESNKVSSRSRLVFAAIALMLLAVSAGLYQLIGRGKAAIDSIAILPSVNANADPNTEYLANGIPESIINSLSQLTNLKVMSRNSVFRFKGAETDAQEVGQKLGVRAVLTGRVMQRGESLTVNIELVDARDNSQIWGQQYNRKLADLFAVQEEIAREISEKLRLKLNGAERQQLAKRPTENLKAFQYYMQGRAYIQRRTHEDLLEAMRYYEKAIGEDGNYALAYAGLADVYVNLGVRGYIAPLEGRQRAEEEARKALALDDKLPEAHIAFGQANVAFVPCNTSLADSEYERAIELSPSLALAHQYLAGSLAIQGRLDESLEEYIKARQLDPLSPIIARQVAFTYFFKRDYMRALELLWQSHNLGPALTTYLEIEVYVQNQSYDELLRELDQAKRERENDPILVFGTGMAYVVRGRRAEALQTIKELEEVSGASLSQAQPIAKIYAALNDKEMAWTWLQRGLSAGSIGIFIKDEPVWDLIRNDVRFPELLRRMGIPQ